MSIRKTAFKLQDIVERSRETQDKRLFASRFITYTGRGSAPVPVLPDERRAGTTIREKKTPKHYKHHRFVLLFVPTQSPSLFFGMGL
jgi:hypothetical protein